MTRPRPSSLAILGLFLGAVALVSCEGTVTMPVTEGCIVGESVQCACTDGGQGAQVCQSDHSFGECQCEPVIPTEGQDGLYPEEALATMDLGGDTSSLDPFDGAAVGGTASTLNCLSYPVASFTSCPGVGCNGGACWSGVCGVTQTSHQSTKSIDLACSSGEDLINPFPVQAKVVAPFTTRYSDGHCYGDTDDYNAVCSSSKNPGADEPCNNMITLQATIGSVTWKVSILHISGSDLEPNMVVGPFEKIGTCGAVGWCCPEGSGSHAHMSLYNFTNGSYTYPGDLLSTSCNIITNDNSCVPGTPCCGADGKYVDPGVQGAQCDQACKECNGGAGCLDTCGGATCPTGDGDYCGGPVGLNPSTLYTCKDGVFTEKEPCIAGCHVAAANSPDSCLDPQGGCPEGDGTYCGASLGLLTDALYVCAGGATLLQEGCSAGCNDRPGATDACHPPVVTSCPDGNGLYCGSTLGLNSKTLYDCQNGNSTVVENCGVTCVVAAAGSADYCDNGTTTSCPSGNGLYCGSTLGLNSKTLYDCQNGNTSVVEVCGVSCVVAAAGQADYCNNGSTSCPSGNGLYCGASLGLNAKTLYNCQNGTNTVAQNCPNSCVIAAAGYPDYCI